MSELNRVDAFLVELFPAYGSWIEKQEKEGRASLYVVRKYVYIARLSGTSFFKIGYSIHPEKRVSDLQISSPVPLELFAAWIVPGQQIETQLHRKFSTRRKSGEWFELTSEDLETLVTHMKEYKRVT